jgi:hypothetical protein
MRSCQKVALSPRLFILLFQPERIFGVMPRVVVNKSRGGGLTIKYLETGLPFNKGPAGPILSWPYYLEKKYEQKIS